MRTLFLTTAVALFAVTTARAQSKEQSALVNSCPQIVQLTGAPALKARLTRELAQRGILSQAVEGCPILSVRLERRGNRLALSVIEKIKRTERAVLDSRTAAAIIESWVRADLTAPLLALALPPLHPVSFPKTPPPPPPPPPLALALVKRPAVVPAPPRKAPQQWSHFAINLLTEVGLDTGSALWMGTSLSGCVSVFRFCIGAVLRMQGDFPIVQFNGLVDQRLSAEMLAEIALPLRIGRLSLVPGFAVGPGWLRHQLNWDPALLGEGPDSSHPGSAQIQDGGLRAELRLLSVVPLRRGFELAFALSVGIASVDSPSLAVSLQKAPAPVSLAETPWGTLRAGLGLRWNGL